MFQLNHNAVISGNTINDAQHLQHPQSGGSHSSTAPSDSTTTRANVSEGSAPVTQNLAQGQRFHLLSQRIQELRRTHRARNPTPWPIRPQAPPGLRGQNPTLVGPDDYYHIPRTYLLHDHNPNNPYRPPSPPIGPQAPITPFLVQAHDLYWCLELDGHYSRQTLSTILRDLQPGYWRCGPESGACEYFVRVASCKWDNLTSAKL